MFNIVVFLQTDNIGELGTNIEKEEQIQNDGYDAGYRRCVVLTLLVKQEVVVLA